MGGKTQRNACSVTKQQIQQQYIKHLYGLFFYPGTIHVAFMRMGRAVSQHFAPRSKTLSDGFMAELSARRTSLTTAKTELETLYNYGG